MLKISIVTPSFNQAQFLEDTINSVLSQNYPNLEYIIIDGGSTDGSVEIIKKYAHKLKYWVSEPDKGRGDAINKGFKHSTGEIMGWLGCGDKYCPWAFSFINEIFIALPQVEWITTGSPIIWDCKGLPVACGHKTGYSRQAFFEGRYLSSRGAIQQESTFWRRSLWERAGGYVDEKFWFAPDFELWSRFWRYADLYTVQAPLAGIRCHTGQKKGLRKGDEINREVLKQYNNKFSMYYYDLRYFLSRIPLLKELVKDLGFKINYDFKSEKWKIKKRFV